MRYRIFIIIFIFLFISCDNEKYDIQKLENFIGIKLENYDIIRHTSGIAIGDSFMVIELKFEKKDIEQVLKEIKNFDKYSISDDKSYYYFNFINGGIRESVIINLKKQTITYSYRD